MEHIQGLKPINLPRCLPNHLIISGPPDEVLQLVPIHTGNFHPLNPILLIPLHFHWWHWRNLLSWQRVLQDGDQQ
jgi:hypothetical protein